MDTFRSHFPRIGMRIVKSAFAVGLCLFIYYCFGREGIPFFLVIAALQSMQPYQKDVGDIAERNVIGTMVGALCSLMVLMMQRFVLMPLDANVLWFYAFITLGVAISLYLSVVLGYGEAAYFSAVVYLCIIMVDMDSQSPFMYVLQRFFETMLGMGIGIVVNSFHLPRRKVRDTLFVAALDDVLHSESSILPEYSKVELNRLLDDGVRLSIITQHSSASFWEAAGSIRFKMPVILLDGAVMYNPEEKRYLAKVELDYESAKRMTELVDDGELSVFQAGVVDDSVIIFIRHVAEDSKEIFKKMRRSIYRNYIRTELPLGQSIIYIFCMGSEEALDRAQEKIREAGLEEQYKIMRYSFHEHPGMGYMRIFSPQADRHRMLDHLRKICGMEKLRSFGNDPDSYDVCVRAAEGESIIKYIRREAEPTFWQKD